MPVTVRTNSELGTALAKPPEGGVILMAGAFSFLNLYGKRYPAPGVVLKAAPGEAASITGGVVSDKPFGAIKLENCAGIVFEGLEIVGDAAAVPVTFGGQSERLGLRDCAVHGPDHWTPADLRKLTVPAVSIFKDSVDCFVEDCDIFKHGGISARTPIRLRIRKNRLTDVRGDAIQVAPNEDLVIEDNEIRRLYSPVLAHFDGIQLQTAGLTKPARGVTIRGNRLSRGHGDPFQSIFMNNESGLAYEGLVIEGNLAAGGQYHGITVTNAKAPVIRGNYVTGDAGSLDAGRVMTPWIRLTGCTDAIVTDNVTTAGPILEKGTTVAENARNTTIPLPAAGDHVAALAWLARAAVPATPPERLVALKPGEEVRLSLPGETLVIRAEV